MILLASPTYFKTYYIVDANVDDNLIVNAIETAQEIDIQSIIGTKLLETLKTQVDTNTLTTDNKKLIDDYLRPTLIRYAASHLALLLNNRFTAQGVVEKESNSSNPVDWGAVRDELRNVAEFYAQRMIRYILGNLALYQDFFKIDNISQMRSRLTSYSIGWHLRRGGKVSGMDVDRGVFSKCY